jgi:hypothetical protein
MLSTLPNPKKMSNYMNSGSTNIQMQAAATTREQLILLMAVQVEMTMIRLKLNYGHKFDESMRHLGGNQS